HSSLCNAIKHIFRVMKHQWCILQIPLEYSMEVQVVIPMALCALHNFIHEEDPEVFYEDYDAKIPEIGNDTRGKLSDGPPNVAEKRRADARHDQIAAEMWADYLAQNA
ncbi:hypothetical protein BDR05DRAFT_890552, partial [Suillus weaverae]